ncbi:CMP-N-acetylneuraminate-beta-galactosamide-alpha-2,3-sialyltransferase 1-like [Pholidichthys leucotaenia]
MYLRFRKSRSPILPLLCITVPAVFVILVWTIYLYHYCPQQPKLCGCHKCLADSDPAFSELIDNSPKPFLSRKNVVSEDIFTWWKPIQGTKCNFTVFGEIMERFLQEVSPIPDVEGPRPDNCRRCAVVGNSGNLKGSRYGPLIDFHDIVIRINRGRTQGFEADVGTKTTHRVMYPESATKLENTTYLLFFPFKERDYLWFLKALSPGAGSAQSRRIPNKDLVMILHPAFIKYVHEVWLYRRGGYPSTGFLTVILSLLMCDEVNVFGFGADSDGNWSHYFEVFRFKNLKTGGHPGPAEFKLIELLHKRQKIVFFKGH